MADLTPQYFSSLLTNLARFFTQVLSFSFMGASFLTFACAFLFLHIIIRAFVPKG